MRKHRQQKKIACLVTEKHENEATKPDTDKSREGAHESADISLCKSLYLLPKCTKTTKTVPKKRRPNARQSGFDAPSSEDNQRVISVERESEDASALSSEKSSTTDEKEKEDSPLSKRRKVSHRSDDASRNADPVAESENNRGIDMTNDIRTNLIFICHVLMYVLS